MTGVLQDGPSDENDLVFDEDFIAAARRREATAEERVRRAKRIGAANDALNPEHPAYAGPRYSRRRGSDRRRWVRIAAVVVLVALVVTLVLSAGG
jgi:ferric-dicitrate binding protein FerR (iron transport regulator)